MTFTLDRSIEVLSRTPPTLQALLGGLSDHWTMSNYGEKTFSPFDVVGHLIHAEHTNWLPRARVILSGDASAPFPPFDRYAMYEASKGKTMAELLQTFASLRASNLDALRALNLTEAQLNSPGTHPDFGAVTLKQLLS